MKKRITDFQDVEAPIVKKAKLETKQLPDENAKLRKVSTQSIEKASKYSKQHKSEGPTSLKKAKPKSFTKTSNGNLDKNGKGLDKPDDWNAFKKQKKELKLKRKQVRAKDGFDVIVKAKKIGEELRKKSLKGGEEKRLQLINELHTLLRGKGHYPKFVLAHDTARLVQWLLKYGSDIIIQQIAKVN